MLDPRDDPPQTEGVATRPADLDGGPAESLALGDPAVDDAPALPARRSRAKALLATAGGKLAVGLGVAAVLALEWKAFDFLTSGLSRVGLVLLVLLVIASELREAFRDELEETLSRRVLEPKRWMTRTQRIVATLVGLMGFGFGIEGGQTTRGALWVGSLLLTLVGTVLVLAAVLSAMDEPEPGTPPRRRSLVARYSQSAVPHPNGDPDRGRNAGAMNQPSSSENA